eukprot:SAG11_NODE_8251_length_1040_cov_1.360255_1_plen_200_part_00
MIVVMIAALRLAPRCAFALKIVLWLRPDIAHKAAMLLGGARQSEVFVDDTAATRRRAQAAAQASDRAFHAWRKRAGGSTPTKPDMVRAAVEPRMPALPRKAAVPRRAGRRRTLSKASLCDSREKASGLSDGLVSPPDDEPAGPHDAHALEQLMKRPLQIGGPDWELFCLRSRRCSHRRFLSFCYETAHSFLFVRNSQRR